MSRVQLALNVADLDSAVDFYSSLFATSTAKRRPGYANFAIANPALKLVLIEGPADQRGRRVGKVRRGRVWYEQEFLHRIGPVALYGLLLTIVVLFALQGHAITRRPGDVARIALPLLAYFVLMFGGSFLLGRRLRLGYAKTATLAFTAAGNNFELAIAVAIGVFGVTSGQALAGVVGPLVEVPVLVALVYAALWVRRHLFPESP